MTRRDLKRAERGGDWMHPICAEPWWQDAVNPFSRALLQARGDSRGLLLLYGADADGFSASYFAHRALATGAENGSNVDTRAVWNFDYDFHWLPNLVAQRAPALVLCFDIPIIRETSVVEAVAKQAPIAVYDHHVVPHAVPTELPDVVFVNSRVLGPSSCNYPASAFSAAFASHVNGELPMADLAVLATGLIGDRADRRNPGLFRLLRAEFPALGDGRERFDLLFHFVRQIDALFRVHIHDTPHGAEAALAGFLREGDPARALQAFAERYALGDAIREVEGEIDRFVRELATTIPKTLLCVTLPLKTFCVGAIASRLAAHDVADVVALGFPVGDRVAFELRTGEDGPDLTEVLAIQREALVPLSAGGHPNAAGALVSADDADEFQRTLANAVEAYLAKRR